MIVVKQFHLWSGLFSLVIYMADNLCYIKSKDSLKKRERKQKIKQAIKEKIMSLHDHNQLKVNGIIDPELILMTCNSVENCLKKGVGIDKKAFVIEILEEIFTKLNQQEKEHIGNQCQFFFDNDLIEVIPLATKVSSIGWNWFKSKL